jgi:DNA-binding PadR family transcriptional regulator
MNENVSVARGSSKTLGSPRGLLRLYILYRLSKEGMSGYDLISDLDSLTSGSWHPGSGSIYPTLKGLQEGGLIKVVSRGIRSRQLYMLTRKGETALEQYRILFNNFATKWNKIRVVLMSLLSSQNLATLLNDSMKMNKSCWERIIESKDLSAEEKSFSLKEYRLLLENESRWVNEAIKRSSKS